jgi:hypothetical protein
MRLLHWPVLALQPLAQVVVTKALLLQLRELLPWQLGAPPSHATQPWPLARQIWLLQVPVQQTCAPAWLFSQAPERQSPSAPQVWPSTLRHAPPTNTWLGLAQTQAPSAPQTRPLAAQLGVQQRWVPFRSGVHELVAHCAPAVQACPPPSRPSQTPVVALQPLPHGVAIREPFSQREAMLPWQVEPAPAHCTQLAPSAAQKLPAQPSAQQTLPPLT